METLKKIVKNEYFPAATVLLAVVLFWTIAMFGGLSLLNNNQPPMATLTWMLFVYAAAVLTPLAGVLAALNIVRRWQRNRQYAQAVAEAEAELPDEVTLAEEPEIAAALESEPASEPAAALESEPAAEPAAALESEPAAVKPEQGRPAQHGNPAPKQPAMNHQAPSQAAAKNHQAKSQPLKKPAQTKQRKKAA
ncbi:hypothetical protein [Arthrobacter sp. B6]|uniref:hypothetical protein n=1 Tax=Arthrobacter sp. B6 TaxID=1570137 RepID=UPI0009ED93F5|nr:hypothetical protein [Arthrobacter sp. B6]